MGNRAIVKPVGKNIGVYLHWNGGRDSVEPFLEYCKLKGYHPFETDYGLARFCQVVSNFFGGSLCIGVQTNIYMAEESARGLDNGIYEVEGWEIVRRYPSKPFEQHTHDRLEMLIGIDKCQPPKERLGAGYFKAKLVVVDELKIGDRVYIETGLDTEVPKAWPVLGVGENRIVNGRNVVGVPYVGKYSAEDPASNPNNYLWAKDWNGEAKMYRKVCRGRSKKHE